MSCTSGSSYIVKSGDTLYIIAQQKLGNGDRWTFPRRTKVKVEALKLIYG